MIHLSQPQQFFRATGVLSSTKKRKNVGGCTGISGHNPVPSLLLHLRLTTMRSEQGGWGCLSSRTDMTWDMRHVWGKRETGQGREIRPYPVACTTEYCPVL